MAEWFSTACCLYGARSKNENEHRAYVQPPASQSQTHHAAGSASTRNITSSDWQ
jgi:hypothetical protein